MTKRILLFTIVVAVALLPMVAPRPQQAHAAGLDLDNTVAVWQFIVPGVPTSKLEVKLAPDDQPPIGEGMLITVADDIDALFPKSGELLLGKTDLVVYDNNDPVCGPSRASNQFCVIQRAKVGQKKQHAIGTQVKLATQLTTKIPAKAAHTTLLSAVSDWGTPPFAISVADDSNFGTSGYLTISHSDPVVDTTGSSWGGSTEYMQYDRSCGTGTQLCIIGRALQPNNLNYKHEPHYPTADVPIHSYVDKHFQIEVKSNAGFFPAGNLLVYSVDGTNQIVAAELMGHNNAATKIKDMSQNTTQFHMTSRGATASTVKPTPIEQHDVGSIVTGPDDYWVCRVLSVQPLPGGEPPGAANSVGAYPVCYSQSQPNEPPKELDPKELLVPVVGQRLIRLHALGQPFLSTGGFKHILFGDVPLVDDNGTKDGVLNLISPCVTDFAPGTNLLVEATLNVDKDYATTDTGTIRVVTDTIPDPAGGPDGDPDTHDDCDDPAGTADITVTPYIYPGDTDQSDDDTDLDGCTDDRELGDNELYGGLRDPWNRWDFFDTDYDRDIDLFDFVQVVDHYFVDEGHPDYDTAFDRGGILGPFDHNLGPPDGVIRLFDILAVVLSYGHDCSGESLLLDAAAGFSASAGASVTVSTGTEDLMEAEWTVPEGELDAFTLVTIDALPASEVPPLQGAQSGAGERLLLSEATCALPHVLNPKNCPSLLAVVFDLKAGDTELPPDNPGQLTLTYDQSQVPSPEELPLELIEAQCNNDEDDDGDTFVNDGCPAVGPPETGAQCANDEDDDDDTFVNDGCPAVGPGGEPLEAFERSMGILHFNEDEGEWESAPIKNRDTDANTITAAITDFSPYGIYEPAVADTDSDGCLDVQENGDVPNQGGQRNALYHWDVFDTPNDANARDKMIRVLDINRVVSRYGADDADGTADINRYTDPLTEPPATGYHPAFDRGGPAGPNDWDQAPPNGMIRVADINAVVKQYGLTC